MWKSMKGRISTDPSYKNIQLRVSPKEFYEWLLKRDDYKGVYAQWVESNYQRLLVPTIDRIESLGHYELSNMRVLSWQDNMSRPKKYFTLEARKEAERRLNNASHLRQREKRGPEINARARELYNLNKEKRQARRRELYSLKSKKY